ncbi:hypothetical protein Dimus_038588 [Dionaea muscipula]
MPSFWNNIVYALKSTAPLVKVLRLIDGEKVPAMGYIYKAMDKAKETIIKSFNEREERFQTIVEIIDRRWSCQLHHPLHAAGYFLNPQYYYNDPTIEQNEDIMVGLYKCVEKLNPVLKIQDKIMRELTLYKRSEGVFGERLAIRHRSDFAPGNLLKYIFLSIYLLYLLSCLTH